MRYYLLACLLLVRSPLIHAQAAPDAGMNSVYLGQIKEYVSSIDNYLKIKGVTRQNITPIAPNGLVVLRSQPKDKLGEDAVKKYLKTTPAKVCPQIMTSQEYKNCVLELNLFANNIEYIDNLLERLEQRSTQLQQIANTSYTTAAELQALQFQTNSIQAQMQNDVMRLNLSVAAYDEKRAWYQKRLRTQQQSKWTGNGLAVGFPSSIDSHTP